jgi:hypothetical protein
MVGEKSRLRACHQKQGRDAAATQRRALTEDEAAPSPAAPQRMSDRTSYGNYFFGWADGGRMLFRRRYIAAAA